MERVQRGDLVQVVRGNDKGKQGRVQRVLPERGAVVVEGINQVKRHTKGTAQSPGGIIEREAPLPACKVMPVDPTTGRPTRVRYRLEDGKKVRVAKSGATIVAAR